MKNYLTKRNIIIVIILIAAIAIEAYEWYNIRLLKAPVSVANVQNDIDTLASQNSQIAHENMQLKALVTKNDKSIKELQTEVESLNKTLNAAVENEIELLVDKLKDKNYVSTYNEGYTWYTAAEALGAIGKPAIPYLVKKVDTKDDYERSLVFYALSLASQADNVKEFAGTDYINITDSFDVKGHEAAKKEVLRWWEKYKDKF